MELRPHFRLIRFSAVPEYQEAINVAVLIVDSRPRLISDFEFEKLACIAPNFNRTLLNSWLRSAADDISRLDPKEISSRLTGHTSQIQIGERHFLEKDVPQEFESRLIQLYLKKPHKSGDRGNPQTKYVDTLIEEMIGPTDLVYGEIKKRAKPSSFLNSISLRNFPASGIHFSRVLVAPKSIVLMDGLNLALTNRHQLRQRASEIGFGFNTFGKSKALIEEIEHKSVFRTAFLFNKPNIRDLELDYFEETIRRDSDLLVDATKTEEVKLFGNFVRQKSVET